MTNNFKQELFELLSIEAKSGEEAKVVKYLLPKLSKLVDKCFLDAAGNLLGELKVGTGEGSTIVLSAHMDSVSFLVAGRKVIFDETTNSFSSTAGILGADDRAGIAIILSVLRNIEKTDFNGTLKIAFCCSEEVGCVGSGKIDKAWYQDAALAIVVDRHGSRDIVTGCGSPYNFCSKEVGAFFENVGAMIDQAWVAVGGGVSDAMTFSENGVNSVNLSAGYYNEHSKDEIVNIMECKDTIQFVLQSLSVVNTFADTFGEVPEGYKSNYGTQDWGSWIEENEHRWTKPNQYNLNDRLGELQDAYKKANVMFYVNYLEDYGDLEFTKYLDNIYLNQVPTDKSYATQEVIISERNFQRMIDQYLRVSQYKPNIGNAPKRYSTKKTPKKSQTEVSDIKALT